jgi:hypothetical protein
MFTEKGPQRHRRERKKTKIQYHSREREKRCKTKGEKKEKVDDIYNNFGISSNIEKPSEKGRESSQVRFSNPESG